MPTAKLIASCVVPYTLFSLYFYCKDNAIQQSKYRKIAPLVFANVYLFLPVWIHTMIVRRWIVLGKPPGLSLAHAQRMLRQWMVCYVLFETLFYTTHRMMHTIRFLFKHVHKVHHELVDTVAFGALYAHPLEFFLCNVLPMSAGPLLLHRPSLLVLCAWLFEATRYVVFSHSGHISSNKHSLHHKHLRGEYGTSGVIDWVLGTSLVDDK